MAKNEVIGKNQIMRGFLRNQEEPWVSADELLNIHQAAKLLGWPVYLLQRAYVNRQGPKASIFNGQLMYWLSVIEDFYDTGISPDLALFGFYNIPADDRVYFKRENGIWLSKDEEELAY